VVEICTPNLSKNPQVKDFLKDLGLNGRRDIQVDLKTIELEVLTWLQLV